MGGWQGNLRLGKPEGEGSKSKKRHVAARSVEATDGVTAMAGVTVICSRSKNNSIISS